MPTISLPVVGDTASGLTLVSLTRSDTGAAPGGVTVPAAFTDAGGGVWNYTFTDASPPPSYAYTFSIQWPDGSSEGAFAGTLEGSGSVTGRYTSSTLLKRRFGAKNIIAWSSTEGTGAEDVQSYQDAIGFAEGEIDSYFSGSVYAIPFTPTGSSLPAMIAEWAEWKAGWWLVTKRFPIMEKEMQAMWDTGMARIETQMLRYRSGTPFQLAGVALSGTGAPGMTIVDPRINRLSDGAQLVPTWQSRGPREWRNGYGYVSVW